MYLHYVMFYTVESTAPPPPLCLEPVMVYYVKHDMYSYKMAIGSLGLVKYTSLRS